MNGKNRSQLPLSDYSSSSIIGLTEHESVIQLVRLRATAWLITGDSVHPLSDYFLYIAIPYAFLYAFNKGLTTDTERVKYDYR